MRITNHYCGKCLKTTIQNEYKVSLPGRVACRLTRIPFNLVTGSFILCILGLAIAPICYIAAIPFVLLGLVSPKNTILLKCAKCGNIVKK